MSFRIARTLPLPNIALRRPFPAWIVWIVAAWLAYVVGKAITSKEESVLIFGGGAVLAVISAIVRRPVIGFYFALAYYPFYAFSRGLAQYLGLPIPLSLLGLWPDALLGVMIFGVVVGCIRDRFPLRFTVHDIPAGLIILSGMYAMVVSLVQGAVVAALYGFHATVTPILFYTVARWLRLSDTDLRRLIGFWLIPYVILGVLSLLDYAFRPKLTIEIAILIRDGFWGSWDPHKFFEWYPRMQSLMFSEQFWGTICAMVVVYCLSLSSVRPLPRWTLPLALFSVGCLVLSMSRGAFVDAVVAVACLFCFRGRHRVSIVVGALLAVAVLGVTMTKLNQDDRLNTLTKRFSGLAGKMGDSSDSSSSAPDDNGENSKEDWRNARVTQWEYVVQQFPIFPYGRGLGRAGAQALFHDTKDDQVAIADGGIFKILAEEGLPGVLLFVIGGVSGVVVFLRLTALCPPDTVSHDRALGRFVTCMLCGLMVHNIGGNIFDAYYIQPLYWLLAGVFVTRAEESAVRSGNSHSALVSLRRS